MEKENIAQRLGAVLLPWYDKGHRELPWRQDREPYHIWISEIMLQQTRVEAVKGYYSRFLEKLPTVEALANAPDALLHKLWEGLGYYSRVRNLKKAAQVICSQYAGQFPQAHESVLKLPGIGPYTAGAICSIAFNLPTPAVDGNVLRLMARLWGEDTPVDSPDFKKRVCTALAAVYPQRAGDFTQALMELGATLCGPNTKPQCGQCPCNAFCRGYLEGSAERLPVRLPKRERRVEEKTVLVMECQGRYALYRRPEKGLLAGLWQFPDVPGKLTGEEAVSKVEEMGLIPVDISCVVEKKHIFTHIVWDMNGVYLRVREMNADFLWLTGEQLETQAALPTAYRQFWEEIGNV